MTNHKTSTNVFRIEEHVENTIYEFKYKASEKALESIKDKGPMCYDAHRTKNFIEKSTKSGTGQDLVNLLTIHYLIEAGIEKILDDLKDEIYKEITPKS